MVLLPERLTLTVTALPTLAVATAFTESTTELRLESVEPTLRLSTCAHTRTAALGGEPSGRQGM